MISFARYVVKPSGTSKNRSKQSHPNFSRTNRTLVEPFFHVFACRDLSGLSLILLQTSCMSGRMTSQSLWYMFGGMNAEYHMCIIVLMASVVSKCNATSKRIAFLATVSITRSLITMWHWHGDTGRPATLSTTFLISPEAGIVSKESMDCLEPLTSTQNVKACRKLNFVLRKTYKINRWDNIPEVFHLAVPDL